jgi:hypothetical protein
MPRSVAIARITVDRPRLYGGARAERSAEWLELRADELESSSTNYALGTFRARRIVARAFGRGDVTATKLTIGAAGSLSPKTRKRIAKWLRSRAAYLRKHWAVARTSRRGWFTQEFTLS